MTQTMLYASRTPLSRKSLFGTIATTCASRGKRIRPVALDFFRGRHVRHCEARLDVALRKTGYREKLNSNERMIGLLIAIGLSSVPTVKFMPFGWDARVMPLIQIELGRTPLNSVLQNCFGIYGRQHHVGARSFGQSTYQHQDFVRWDFGDSSIVISRISKILPKSHSTRPCGPGNAVSPGELPVCINSEAHISCSILQPSIVHACHDWIELVSPFVVACNGYNYRWI